LAPTQAQAAEKLGVVVLHGKNGSPDKNITEVVRVLRNVGFLVSAPEMPWSRKRRFDVTYQQSLVEIGIAVEDLHVQGATQVALVGYSLGANAALAYTASRGGIFALVILAPAHDPERHRNVFYADVHKAKEMLVSGRGRERSLFMDINLDKDYDLSTTAEVYLSYNDPEGAAVMPRSAAQINPPLPILWVLGLNDPLTRLGRYYAFEKAPRHPKSQYEEISADHITVPAAAAPLVAEWLRALVQ
jgi:dienelactone hydrolase